MLEHPAVFLDYNLQPLVASIPQFIKDTSHFIEEIEGKLVSESAVLVTLDVNSLYTSIPHEDIFLVVDLFLDQHSIRQPPKYFLLELLDLIIENNYFKFEDRFFYQTKGVLWAVQQRHL